MTNRKIVEKFLELTNHISSKTSKYVTEVVVYTFHEYDNTCTNFLMELNEVIIQCCY